MMHAAALSAPATIAAPRAQPQPSAEGFSFDAAVAAATRSAARALDVHGGAPTQAVTQSSTAAQSAGETPDAAAPEASADAPPADARAEGRTSERAATTLQAAAAPSALIAATAQANAAPGAVAPAAVAPVQSPALATAAIRETAARIKAEAPPAPAPTRAPAQTVAQFAEILARRLDWASQFDLRLDPPALGGVEGRLTLSDDGEAVLSLAFDNQSAVDLFRRDEGALRSALANAGFDLPRHNLQMTFRAAGPAMAEPVTEPAAQTNAFAPAPLHRGAVDIRA